MFDPERKLTDGILHLEGAYIVPRTYKRNGAVRPGGVLDRDGAYVDLSACRYTSTKVWSLPLKGGIPDERVHELPGTWIYGGVLDPQFAHCLVESFSRLWAVDYLQENVAGVAFVAGAHRADFGRPKRYIAATSFLFRAFSGLPERIECLKHLHRVERLIVPPQAMGGGDMCAGSPEFRRFVKTHFLPDIAAQGSEKLYVSRARLQVLGNIMLEEIVEQLFRENGYEIFYPEDHDLATQAARYRAARKIVAVDGSALHMLAYALGQDQQVDVAIIPRRLTENAAQLARQIELSSAANVWIINSMMELFHPQHIYGEQSNVLMLHNFQEMARQLKLAGFVADTGNIRNLTREEIQAALAKIPKEMFSQPVLDNGAAEVREARR